jgi:hypothetical protein
MSEYTPEAIRAELVHELVSFGVGGGTAWPENVADAVLQKIEASRWLAEVKREARREAFLAVLHVVNSVRDIAAVNRLREADQADE